MIGSSSNSNATTMEQQFQQEREFYVNKIEQLQEFIKSSALLVLEEESNLVQLVESEDAQQDIEELRERIVSAEASSDDDSSSHRRTTLLSRKFSDFRTSIRDLSESSGSERSTRSVFAVKKAKLTPEKALSFAIKSMRGSVEHFENERDILVSKMERMEAESKAKEQKLQKELDEYKQVCQQLQEERNSLSLSCREQLEDIENMQSLRDQIESLEGDKDALERECEEKDNEISFLKTKEEVNNQRSREQEQELENEFSSFGLLEEFKAERDALEQKCQEQEETIAQLKKKNQSSRFRGGFDAAQAVERADSWRHEETKAKFHDLQNAYMALQTLSNDQKDTIQKLERQNDQLQTEAEEYMVDLEQGNTKCQSLSKAVVLFSEQEEQLRHRIQDLEEEIQNFVLVNKSQAESVAVMRQASRQKDAAWEQMTSKLDDMEDENGRLSARCASLEHALEALKSQRTPTLLNARVEQSVLGPLQ